jgi:CBS domain-containing protein
MQVREIMTRDVKLLTPRDSIREAAIRMRDEDIGSLPVTDGDRLIGVVTDRDLVVRALAEGQDPDTPIGQAMTERVLYCFDDEPVESVAENMARNQIRRLPVVTREKRLCGIVALGDIATSGKTRPAESALEGISRAAH